jgi:alpha-L-fucosidase
MGPDVRWVGTESGYGRETEWSVVPSNNLDQQTVAALSQQDMTVKPMGDMQARDLGSREKIKQAKALVWYPAETDVSIRPGWFYHDKEDTLVKSPRKLLDIYFNSVGRNGVLLLNIPPDRNGLLTQYDVQALLGWKQLRDSLFARNLVKAASISATTGKQAAAVADDKFATYWQAAPTDTTATLELNWKGIQSFNTLMLQEYIATGQRIEAFVLEYFTNGEWKVATHGTTVGYKRLISFAPVQTSRARLRILSSRLSPTLSEIGLYMGPTR